VLTTQYISHSSNSEVLLLFKHRLFFCDMNTILYNLILFTNLNFKFEIDRIIKQSDLTVMGEHKMCSRTLAGLRHTSGGPRVVHHCSVDFIQRTVLVKEKSSISNPVYQSEEETEGTGRS
jgi:hypothetical protein